MTFHHEIPEWAEKYIYLWRSRLLLEHWRLYLRTELCLFDDPQCRGGCEADSHTNTAHLTFRADISNDDSWRQTVIHEIIHVTHAHIDHAVECVIIPELPSAAQELAKNAYRQQMESFVASLATTLYRLSSQEDFEPPSP